jgi:hypothetical protein
MKNLNPKINIVVLNYNGKDCLKRCLSSLFCVDYSNFEVVVVDNNSQDGSLEMARLNFSRATFIKNEQNLGFSAGNNVGIKYSLEKLADFVLLLNNDTEVEKDFLVKLLKYAKEHEEAGIISPLIFSEQGESVWFSGGKIDWWRMKTVHIQKQPEKNLLATDFISGCAMLIRAEVFRKSGLFDENFFLYWEDVDFSVRAKKAGFTLSVVASARIRHFEKSEEKKENKLYWLVLSGLLFFQKNTPKYLKAWIFIYTLLRRLKNWNDVQKKQNPLNLAVQKAYRDFKLAKKG